MQLFSRYPDPRPRFRFMIHESIQNQSQNILCAPLTEHRRNISFHPSLKRPVVTQSETITISQFLARPAEGCWRCRLPKVTVTVLKVANVRTYILTCSISTYITYVSYLRLYLCMSQVLTCYRFTYTRTQRINYYKRQLRKQTLNKYLQVGSTYLMNKLFCYF